MRQLQHVGIYARVSSEQQTGESTIASQLAALRARVSSDGQTLPAEQCFVDDGYSGATLVRPALERLRDLAAAGNLDRVYVHSPDRLARRYAYQVLLVEGARPSPTPPGRRRGRVPRPTRSAAPPRTTHRCRCRA